MKKKITLIAMFIALVTAGFSQAPLPTGYDFNNFTSAASLPTGWSTNIAGTFTYATGQAGTAGRLDLQGEYVRVFTQNAIGTTTFYLKGFIGGTVTSWSGTFKVQESTNGTTWTDLASYTTLSSTAYQQFTVNPASASRYLQFIFSTKVSGCNVALDEVTMIAAPVTVQEINVQQNAATIFSGGTSQIFSSPVGTPINETFVVQNLGTVNTLGLSSATITGPGAADYMITSPTFPATVAPSSNQNLVISFTPSVAGTRAAVLTINNDDSDEGTYTINLYGIGGNLASEPIAQPTNLTTPILKSYRVGFTFTPSVSNPDGYLVIRKTSSSTITDTPTDGMAYMAGDAVGTSKVVYSGPATGAILNYIFASTQYQLAVFSYNGSGTYTNYNTTSPLSASVTSLGSMMPSNEYNSISTSASTFLSDLSAHINPHSFTYYSNYDETMLKLFEARDTTAGQKVVTCVYSNEQYIYTEPFTWGYMSREHSYCHNWMPTNPADGTGAAPNNVERPEYNDQHHLFPTNQNQVNAQRSNYPMGIVVSQLGTYLSCKWGLDASGNHVFEPRDEHKGDFARAVFYMATCYNGINDAFGTPQNWKFRNPIGGSIAYGQDQNVLKQWHYQDPPSKWEIARNDFLDSLQGNRNPFVDSVQYVCYIDFSNMTKIAAPGIPCNTVGIQEKYKVNFDYSIFPNPTASDFSILLNSAENAKYTIRISDVTGRLVHTKQVQVNNGSNYLNFDKLGLQSGAYMIEMINGNNRLTKKLIIE